MCDAKSQHLTILLGDRGDPAFRSKLLKRIEPILFAMLKCENAKTRRRLRYLMEYQSSGILSIITVWFQQKKPISVEELVEILMAVTTNGVQKKITDLLRNNR